MAKKSLLDIFQSKLSPSRVLSEEGADLIRLLDEPQGWERFLRAVGGKTFTQPFATFHTEFWDWYWQLTLLRRERKPLSREILTFLAGWSRGGGKSANVEWACIVEGAMGLEGYVLYVSLTQASANSHVGDIRKRLESDEVSRYFPDLAEPMMGKHHNQYGWRQDFLMTKGGWAIRPVGLDTAVRGFREGDLRPTLIVFDDIDDYNLSLAEVQGNLGIIARSILPSGTPNTIHLIAQNLIAEHCAVNQIYTGKTDVLGDHLASVYKAFDDLTIEKQIDEKTGKSTYEITTCTPTWEGMDIDAARINLNKSGLEAFYAEYQHDFSLDQSEKVVPEFDDTSFPPLHVITWEQFHEKFGTYQRIPSHWQAGLGLDIGYTAEHLAAWTWMCVSAEDAEIPFAHFVYRGMTFTGKSLTEQVDAVLNGTDEVHGLLYKDDQGNIYDERDQYVTSKMSHEKLGERMILNREYEFNFSTCQFGKEDGVPQWRTLLRVDKHQPHPFHADEKLADGTYALGRPSMFYVVEAGQLTIPRNDAGLAVHRAQLGAWRRRKVTLTNSGVSDALPMKYKDDANDSTRMLLVEDILNATPLTKLQRRRLALKEATRTSDLTLNKGNDDYGGILMRRKMEIREIELAEQREQERIARVVVGVLGSPAVSPRFRKRF